METRNHEHPPLETTRLSHSLLWQLQLNYFDRCGIEAWRSGAVPHHITSSAFTAEAYARVVFGFFRDCHARAHDSSQPLHIVELGSGSGRFAYLFLRRFLSLHRNSVLKDLSFRFVMTDFTEQNLEYWRTHKWLKPFVEAGVLDFARFDVERDEQLHLIHSREVLSSETLRNPLVVIANYLFDSIPQDAFSIVEGQFFENLLTLTIPDAESDPTDPDILSRVEMEFGRNPFTADYYDDPSWNRILLEYKRRFTSIEFLFPTAALRCIRNLHRISNRRMLLLSADRGYTSDEALLGGEGLPTIAMHGSFSMMVDYQIIGEYCRLLGGQVMHP
ncbi:MAG TPA: class I SAM-dependent methyltransferase, partial [Pyrinomonadaceae bacterium]|nr:class I SAM-dependent methyltransferase [Pyrinomonadaceae bacterium]